MGSSISAIYDDMDDYEYLCKKYNTKQQDLYSIHYDWVIDLNNNKTNLSFEEYEKQANKKEKERKIEGLKQEIKDKQKELSKLKRQL